MKFIYTFDKYINDLNEGLISTYDIDKTIVDISELINKYGIKFNINKVNNKFQVSIIDFDKISDLPTKLDIILSTLFNLYGWFPSIMDMTNFYNMIKTKKFDKDELLRYHNNLINVKITFESKFDLISNNIPDKLYHLSIQQYKDDILNKGLFPKQKSKLSSHDYDGRIYLCKGIMDCKVLIPRMVLFYSDEKNDIIYNKNNPKKIYNKNTKWVIFEIDTDKATIDKMYQDPNYLNGYYYLNNIPKESISIVDEEK